MKPSESPSHPARKWILCCASVMLVLAVLFLGVLLYLPSCAPTLAWKSGWVELQEPAIPHLMNRLHVGMTYDELVEIMGKPPGSDPLRGGTHGYNVNSWYNRGIDVTVSNGVVVFIFEYD